MSWNLRDSKPSAKLSKQIQNSEPPEPRNYGDEDALPTVLAGMDDWEDAGGEERWTASQRRELEAMGMVDQRTWDIWGAWMRRGVEETGDAS
jgi:hypothetical protein